MSKQHYEKSSPPISNVLPFVRKSGVYIRPAALRPTLTSEQRRQLSIKVSGLVPNWVTHQGHQWIYNHLRVAFRVSRFEEIPQDCFEAAMELIDSKKESISKYIEFLYEAKAYFEREILGAGTPWTPYIKRMLTKKLAQQVILPPQVDWLALAEELAPAGPSTRRKDDTE